MSAIDLLQKIGETLGTTATVKSVFGEPIQANGKTIVPVARVAYGFGGGLGTGRDRAHTDTQGEGGGGGGACGHGPRARWKSPTRARVSSRLWTSNASSWPWPPASCSARWSSRGAEGSPKTHQDPPVAPPSEPR